MADILYQRGADKERFPIYLMSTRKKDIGQVLNLDEGILYGPAPTNSILARGYWFPFTGDDEEEKEVKRKYKEIVKNGKEVDTRGTRQI